MKTLRKVTVNVSISLPKSLYNAGREAAVHDQRSLSSLVSSLLKEHLCAEGYISPLTLEIENKQFRRARS